ncbi:MAG: aminotransferase class I/II-fold pyridoxal phosphate-dependent enzyme [Chloroflexota bacterium]|nr:MAG: aminotransferase class I/II-fold pyridoxal phosphate-dependent enzyme [Chloroflexota bacterium]
MATHTFSLPKTAARLERMPPYGFELINRRIAQLSAAGADIIRLDMGSPDMPPPQPVIEMLQRSAENPNCHNYGSYRGLPAFRKAVADYYARRFGVQVDPDTEVLPLIGSKEGIVNLALAFLDRGDAAIVPDLNYPAYTMGALMAGGDVILMHLDPERNYAPDLQALRQHPDLRRAKLLWVNYPNNPTGATCDLNLYAELIAFCREHDLLLCSDNPYAEVVYDGYRAPSALQVEGALTCTVEFMSLSKLYNMAGWRLGACLARREVIEALLTIKSNVDSGHFRPIYEAGALALNATPQSWIDQRNAIYQARRDAILAACPSIGLSAFKTSGSLYVWARVADGDDTAYVQAALEQAQVSLTAGSMYGPAGKGYVRISVGVEDSRLQEAIARLQRWYANWN